MSSTKLGHLTSIGQRIKYIRKITAGTQRVFGLTLGISTPYVSQLEKDQYVPSDQLILSICRAFNVCRKWLETGEGEIWTGTEHENGLSAPEWYEILNSLHMTASIFDITSEGDIFISTEMKYVHSRMHDAVISHKNLVIAGDIGTGKTVIVNRFRLLYGSEDIKIASTSYISLDDCTVQDFYDTIILDISGQNTKLTRRLDERELQTKRVLEEIRPKPVALIVDNAGDVPRNVILQLISFQESTDVENLSVILCGLPSERLKSLPNIDTIALRGLNYGEIAMYLEWISHKSNNRLPRHVPSEIFVGAKGFFDIRNRYLRYVWTRRQ